MKNCSMASTRLEKLFASRHEACSALIFCSQRSPNSETTWPMGVEVSLSWLKNSSSYPSRLVNQDEPEMEPM